MGRKKQRKVDVSEKIRNERMITRNSIKDSNSVDSNMFIIEKKQNKKKEGLNIKNILTKAQRKKLQKLQEKKEKDKIRKSLYESLNKYQMSKTHFNLLERTANIGQKETSRQKVKRIFFQQKAGISDENYSELFQDIDNKEYSESNFNESDSFAVEGNSKRENLQSNGDSQFITLVDSSATGGGVVFVAKNPKVTGLIKTGEIDQSVRSDFKIRDNVKVIKTSNRPKRKRTQIVLKNAFENIYKDKTENTISSHVINAPIQFSEDDGPLSKKSKASSKFIDSNIETPSSSKLISDKSDHIMSPEKDFDSQLKTTQPESSVNIKEIQTIINPKKIKMKKFVVHLNRDPEIQENRMRLPVCEEEHNIIEVIEENDVTIICAETGSGKTTQIPQFLYEAGYSFHEAGRPGIIGITEPRRIAAITTSQRIALEMNRQSAVSYQIRYDSKVTEETAIKLMTDGILLREISSDFLLRKYSVIILDEAHERNINTDVLIGLLSRIVPLRREMSTENSKDDNKITPLKLIIMSATLCIEDFTQNIRLFPKPPHVINISSRQFPVSTHFNIRTPVDSFSNEMFEMACKIHKTMPKGGILMFMTGRKEIDLMCLDLKAKFHRDLEQSSTKLSKESEKLSKNKHAETFEFGGDDRNEIDGTFEEFNDNDEEIIEDDFINDSIDPVKILEPRTNVPVAPYCESIRILPLYSLLPSHLQLKVFEPTQDNCRLIVIATNVAETSITIPGIKYVIDCGKEKLKVFDKATGMSTFIVDWISKSSAEQRSGRSCRTGPGHCYRLYSSAVFDRFFPQFSVPEILRTPVDGTVLNMASMGINDIEQFPLPTPMDTQSIRTALTLLNQLGACKLLTSSTDKNINCQRVNVTTLGKTLNIFPISARFAKMIALAHQGNLLPFVIAIVASISVGQIQYTHSKDENNDQSHEITNNTNIENKPKSVKSDAIKKARQLFFHKDSDFLSNLRIIGAFEFVLSKNNENCFKFCSENFLNSKQMFEIEDLRRQLILIVRKIYNINKNSGILPDSDLDSLSQLLLPPTKMQSRLIRQIIASSFLDHIARR